MKRMNEPMHEMPPPRVITWPTDDERIRAFKEYTEAVGKVAYAWNYLQEKLALVLSAVLQADRTMTLAMWYSTESDRTQREFLKAAVKAAPNERWEGMPAAKEDILWLLDQANKLAGMRNTAVHAPCNLYVGGKDVNSEMGPAFFQGHPRAGELHRKLIDGGTLLIEFDYYERFAETLSLFAVQIESGIIGLESGYPWPARPDLPGRRSSMEIRGN